MLTFSCFTFDNLAAVPNLSFIVTSSLERARELARRELLRERAAIIEICDGPHLLCTVTADQT
jgi:hypothetical protein